MDKLKIKNLKFLILICNFTFYILHFTLTCFAQDKIIAIVNNDIITQKDLDDFTNFIRMQLQADYKGGQIENKIESMKLDLLDRLIEDSLILQEAKKKIEIKPNVWVGMEPDENKVKARIDELKKRYPTEVEFQRALSQQGLTQADIELKIKEQLLMYNIIEHKIRSKIVVNPREVTDFYEKNTEEFKTLQQREVTSITLDNENLANNIFNEVKDSKALSDIAGKYSLSVNKIVVSQDGKLKKDIENAIFKLSIDEVSRPININGIFYIFRLDNIIVPRRQNLSEVQAKIYSFLFDKKLEQNLAKWLDELKAQSYIKILQD